MRLPTTTLDSRTVVPGSAGSDALVVAVYEELRYLADHYLKRERRNHTLQPTALVHEAYLRLAEQRQVKWRSRDHFIAVAAEMMRRVLVDYARGHKSTKRGAGEYRISLEIADKSAKDPELHVLAIDEA